MESEYTHDPENQLEPSRDRVNQLSLQILETGWKASSNELARRPGANFNPNGSKFCVKINKGKFENFPGKFSASHLAHPPSKKLSVHGPGLLPYMYRGFIPKAGGIPITTFRITTT
jgi:hypothetical protein